MNQFGVRTLEMIGVFGSVGVRIIAKIWTAAIQPSTTRKDILLKV
jgi:hypothetical protein